MTRISGLPLEPTEDEVRLRSAIASIAADYGPDFYRECSAKADVHHSLWNRLGKDGHLGVHLPVEYGGGGGGLHRLGVVLEECAAAGIPLPPALFSCAVNGMILTRHATEEQRRRWLPGIADGSVISAFAMTEKDAGLNTFNITSTAVEDGEEWVISGEKTFVTAADVAPWMLLVCRTGTDDNGRAALSMFVVDTDAPGITMRQLPTDLQVPERAFDVRFDEVRVSQENMIGAAGKGLRAAFDGMNAERLLVGYICTGVGQYALDKAVSRVREREIWRMPLGAHQAVAHPLARAKIALESASLTAQKACLMYEAGMDPGLWSNISKISCVDAGLQALDAAIQAHGGAGFATEANLINYWSLLRAYQVGPVSTEMVLNFVAEHSLSLPRSY